MIGVYFYVTTGFGYYFYSIIGFIGAYSILATAGAFDWTLGGADFFLAYSSLGGYVDVVAGLCTGLVRIRSSG